mgnify:CR=1 FL=1
MNPDQTPDMNPDQPSTDTHTPKQKILPRDKEVHPPTTDGARTREIASGESGKDGAHRK